MSDVLTKYRVEVQSAPTGLPNLLKNPSGGTKGAWGWVTSTTGVSIGAQPLDLYLTTTTSQATGAASEAAPITVGQWAGARFDITNTGASRVRIRVQFLDSTKALISSGTQSALSNSGTVYAPTMQAPAGSVYVRFRMDLYNTAGSGNPAANGFVQFRKAMLTRSATDPGTAFAFVEPVVFVDVTGKSVALTTDAPALEPGIASCAITDPTYDQAGANALAPGRTVRFSGWDGTQWVQFYEGEMTAPISTYVPKVKVSFEAADVVSRLAGTPRANGVGTIAELPYILEGKGIPWDCEGPGGNQVPSATNTARNDNASLLDQVTIVRDSDSGFAWVNRFNVLKVIKRSSASTTPFATLSDAAGSTYSYSSIEVDNGNPDSVVNTVRVIWLRKLASGQTKEVQYGPYINQASVDTYGTREATYTLQGATETKSVINAWGNAVLTANATPIARAYSLRIPIRSDADRLKWLTLSHYDVLRVTKAGALAAVDHRVVRIKHELTPEPNVFNGYRHVLEVGLVPVSTIPVPTGRGRRIANARAAAAPLANDDTEGLWQTPTLQNSWANLGGANDTAGYMVIGGVCYLKGTVTGGALNSNIFTLPSGARPAAVRRFAVPASAAYGQVHVNASGGIACTAGTVSGFVALDNISFPVDQ